MTDGEPIDPDELEAQREAAAEDRAERQRESAEFDAPKNAKNGSHTTERSS